MFDFSVLLLNGAYATSVATTLDMLSAAAVMAPKVGAPLPRWQVVSAQGGLVDLSNGLRCATARLRQDGPHEGGVWIVPGMGLTQPTDMTPRLQKSDARRLAQAITRHVGHGGTVAASCSSVFLLATSGVLQARQATTSWWLASVFQKQFPDVRLNADRMVIADGPTVTAGAAFGHTDLMLHLLRQRFGVPLADAVSKVLLIDGRQAQAPFVVPEVLANGHAWIAQLTERLESSLPRVPSVAALAQTLNMAERTLARRMRDATGHSPLQFIQTIRLRRARQLLESSRMSVEQVAEAVGYGDASTLRRLMKKTSNATPSRFRQGAF
jgi:transcriptional regulator GlxA family with amidase domain